jgi:hypothetical protein
MKTLNYFFIILLTISCINFSTSKAQSVIGAGVDIGFKSCSSANLYSSGSTILGQNNLTSITPGLVLGSNGNGALAGIKDIDVKYDHALALSNTGNVWTWGIGTWGQFGNLTNGVAQYPTQVLGVNGIGVLDSIIAVSVGYYHSLFLKQNGKVFACGYNSNGQLGDNSTSNRNYIDAVNGENNSGFLDSINAISSGLHHNIALKWDSTVWTWGNSSLFPVKVNGLSKIVAISSNDNNNLALKSDGTVWSWGNNSQGQLGIGSYSQPALPAKVINVGGVGFLTNIVSIACGDQHAFAIKSNGSVVAWGYNFYGQLGDGSNVNRTTPVQVIGVGGTGNLSNVGKIKGGGQHSICVLNNGTILAWGRNTTGQLGDGTTINRNTPVIIPMPCLPLGINTTDELHQMVELYPNPITDKCIIKLKKEIQNGTLVVYDLIGRKIIEKTSLQGQSIELSLANTKTGIYLLQLEENGKVFFSDKLIITE